jgi:hypothetical protein
MVRIYMVGTHNVEKREWQCRKKMKERAAVAASGFGTNDQGKSEWATVIAY